jgi:hypothetical protein
MKMTIQPGNQLHPLIDSLRSVGTITTAELVRVDPGSYDVLATALIARGVKFDAGTVLEFVEVES